MIKASISNNSNEKQMTPNPKKKNKHKSKTHQCMQTDQSRLVIVLDGEGDAAEGEANFASKKASKHFRTIIYIKFHLMH